MIERKISAQTRKFSVWNHSTWWLGSCRVWDCLDLWIQIWVVNGFSVVWRKVWRKIL